MQLKNLYLVSALAAVGLAQDQSLSQVLQDNQALSSLATYVGQFPDLLDQLSGASNITILAPSNSAFDQLLQNLGDEVPSPEGIQALLTYHVVAGIYRSTDITDTPAFVPTLLESENYTAVTGGQVVEAVAADGDVTIISGLLSSSTVTQADIEFTGGVIHIIDTVLTIPQSTSDTAIASGLTALAGALDAAGLVQDVDTTADLTIFAPSNDAFLAIGSALGDISAEDLAGILSYHVVSGNIGYSSDLTNGQTLEALSGDELTITIEGEDVFVNAAKVITPNVLVANGVVHVIDNVLNPSETATPTESATSGAPAFSGASSVTSLDLTTGVPAASTTIGADTTTATDSASPSGSGAATPNSSDLAPAPLMTGAIGAAALFGAGAAIFNY